VRPEDGPFTLTAIDPAATHRVDRARAKAERDGVAKELRELQERLTAERQRSLLVVLQGMDTSGKDGTIEHVMSGLNPQGVHVHAFKQPTPLERRHDFLWRIRRELPEPGGIAIFNRSQYEDVLVARVDALAPPAVIERRYDRVNRFEADLVKRGTRLVKVMLHISFGEQRRRLVSRLESPEKRWKFSADDVDKRSQWGEYQAAYDLALQRCSPPDARWYVVPADHRWFRNFAVARLVLETLREMGPQYPEPDLDVPALLERLRAS
jgi:PPK2 family polyphosphate:nucleotide phosphotransferase